MRSDKLAQPVRAGLCLIAISVLAHGQTKLDLGAQGKDVDFSTAPSTRPSKVGQSLPATCNAGETFFNTSSAPGNNWYGCSATNTWNLETGGSAVPPSPTVSASGAQLTIGGTCAPAIPCNVRVGSTVFAFTGAATVTLSGGSGTAYVYVDQSGALIVGHNLGAGNLSCNAACAAVNGITAFPVDSIPVWAWTASAGAWNPAGGTDQRASLSQKVVTCGANMQCVNSGTTLTLSANSVGGGGGLTAPLVDFTDHASTATAVQQTLATLALPAGAIAANNDYAILSISGGKQRPTTVSP